MPLAFLHKPIYARRIEVLSKIIEPHLSSGDHILDIGSGGGALAAKLRSEAAAAGKEIAIQGIEKHPRGGEEVETLSFDGYQIPCEDGHYDMTILADVVHHEEDYMQLLKEAVRVTKKYLVIKDHTPRGLLGYRRICFMDWAANNPYGVKCLYRYFTAEEWREIYESLGVSVKVELESIRLYPEPFNLVFGNSLQYLAVLSREGAGE
ncbi:MAG: class I SAM-dependent methyltransferase [Akkermansiaceae bacterium]|nr:class I SAM-dependent methyltransferase [Akkermansiaceae bacterium]